MRVLVNGVPKSGTHALKKAVALLGVESDNRHVEYGMQVDHDKHVFIKRDPRNVLLSKVRFEGQPVTQGMVILKMQNFNGEPFNLVLSRYAPWLTQAPHIVVYEELISDKSVLRRIAKYLGVHALGDAFSNLPGHTATWNPEHSDYRYVWTAEVEAAWNDIGGPAILQEWGYV